MGANEGKGFPLVLIHGFLGSSIMWRPQIDFFKDHFRVITPDLPGFGKSNNVMNALYKGFVVSAVASLVILWPVTDHVIGFTNEYTVNDKTFNGMDLYYCGVIGLIITGLLIWITEYYTGTSYRPVKSVALSSTTGHGTNVIQGLAVSMEATAIPALIIVAGILFLVQAFIMESRMGFLAMAVACLILMYIKGLTLKVLRLYVVGFSLVLFIFPVVFSQIQ